MQPKVTSEEHLVCVQSGKVLNGPGRERKCIFRIEEVENSNMVHIICFAINSKAEKNKINIFLNLITFKRIFHSLFYFKFFISSEYC